MGRFDGVLLCSDWDGTLYSTKGVGDKNIAAIKYFQEQGGLFTLSSGRPIGHLNELITDFTLNTYAITLNGAIIVDNQGRDVIYEGFLDEYSTTLVEEILKSMGTHGSLLIYYKSANEILRHEIKSPDEYNQFFSTYPIYKAVLVSSSTESIAHTERHLKEFGLREYIFVRSWSTGIELLMEKNAKGAAVKRLKEKTGSRLLITVGDFENDIDMLAVADISYAVGNACDLAKHVATRTTVPASEGAIAAIIEEIDQEISSASI